MLSEISTTDGQYCGAFAAPAIGVVEAAAEPSIRNVCVSEASKDARSKGLGSISVEDIDMVATGVSESYTIHSFCDALIMVDGRKRYVPLDAPICDTS